MLGLAIGDALGAPVEFKIRDVYPKVIDFQEGGTHQLPAGYWTDDTSLALCLADSFIEKRQFDANDQIQRYIKWWKEGYNSSTGFCFDIGNTTYKTLDVYYRNPGSPALNGLTDLSSAGNGSLMRLAPAALFYANDTLHGVEWAAKTSKTTHSSKVCVDACMYFAGLIIGALKGEEKSTLINQPYRSHNQIWFNNQLEQDVYDLATGYYKTKERKVLSSTGYVIDTLECALWAFANSDTFEEGAILAVNLGGDTDTIGAVYGQLAGAFYGVDNIPKKWVDNVYKSSHIQEIAKKLYEISR